MNAMSIGTPSPSPVAPPIDAIRSAWLPVSAPIPWIIPTASEVRGP